MQLLCKLIFIENDISPKCSILHEYGKLATCLHATPLLMVGISAVIITKCLWAARGTMLKQESKD